jgi:hypothetical protein
VKGHAYVELADLRELLTDPDTRGNTRTMHFRFVLNGRCLREFRQQTLYPGMTGVVDLTWLIRELLLTPDAIDLRCELTPES